MTRATRRTFLRQAVATAAATTGFGLARAAVIAAHAQSRVVLTAESLAGQVPGPSDAQFADALGRASRDLKGYLRERFELTARQVSTIDNFPAADVRALQSALDRAVRERRRIVGGAWDCELGGPCNMPSPKLKLEFPTGQLKISVYQ